MSNLEETFADLASFSLAQPNDILKISDNSFYIYIGIALFVIIIAYFTYKYYLNQKKVRFLEENSEINECSRNNVCNNVCNID